MALKFLDMTGLQTLWSKAVAKFAPKNHTHDNATADAAGFTKLYGGTGAKEDGAMTQKAASDTFVKKAGDTVTGMLRMQYGTTVWMANSTTNNNQYMKLATLTITKAWADTPITIEFTNRKATAFRSLNIMFGGSSSTDPALKSFTVSGGKMTAGKTECYIKKTATSTWDIYVGMAEVRDDIVVQNIRIGERMNGYFNIVWKKETVANVPDGATQATPLEMLGTIDEAKKVTNALTVGSKTYDGSKAVALTAEDTGALPAQHYESRAHTSIDPLNMKTGFYNVEQSDIGTDAGNFHRIIALGEHKLIPEGYSTEIAFPYEGGKNVNPLVRTSNVKTWGDWRKLAFLDQVVPTTRKINTKPLSGDVTLTAADVKARADTWKPAIADVTGLQDALNNKVPTTRTINTKPLSSDVTLTADDVGAEECFRNPNLLGGTNQKHSTTPESVTEATFVNTLSVGGAPQETRDALIGRTLTLSFRARRDTENATYSRIVEENTYDIRTELKATWSKTPGGDETKETIVATFDVEATSVPYTSGIRDDIAPVFSKTFTMPAADDEYNSLKELTSTIHMNVKPSEGNIYTIHPKLEVSSKATPWIDVETSALQTSGGTMTGQATFNATSLFKGGAIFDCVVNVKDSTNPVIIFIPANSNIRGNIILSSTGKNFAMRVNDGTDGSKAQRELRIYPSSQYKSISQALYLYDNDGSGSGGTYYRIWHEGNIFFKDSLPSSGVEGQICFVPADVT